MFSTSTAAPRFPFILQVLMVACLAAAERTMPSYGATLGARYHSGPWNTAFNIATWENHEAIFFEDDTLVYDGIGAELYTSYEWSDRVQLYGGFNYTDPDIDDPRVDPDFGIEFLIFGASWFATEESFAYIEGLLSSSEDVDGSDVDSVISAGYRFDF